MFSKTILITTLAAFVDARFGQEQGNGAIAAITALSNFGSPGAAATLGGNSIQFLLAAANPCGKLTQADAIVAQLGTDAAVIAAARGLVAAEQNFNPFVVSVPTICSDATLPATEALRGVVPLVDPAVGGSALENSNSKISVAAPFAAVGLSVADVMVAHGFANFTTTDAAGNKGVPSLGEASSSSAGASSAGASSSSASTSASTSGAAKGSDVSSSAVAAVKATSSSALACAGTTFVTVTKVALATSSSACGGTKFVTVTKATASSAASSTSSSTPSTSITNSTIAGLSFGLCVPTMKFEGGLNGRPLSEFTFQAIDPLVNRGQEEALNPNIITNRICDQLSNVCGANAAAKAACAAAKILVAGLGRDVGTAQRWNAVLGFEGADTDPDGVARAGVVGHS
ncbi:hypothetical protein NHQ30_006032 [Ciborinia camelliae]|nr:hypothetical protein NHQ30_006032 [Ciborinia camelliae]